MDLKQLSLKSTHKHWILERSYTSPHLSVSCAEADYRCILVRHAHLAEAGPAGCDPGEQPVLWADCQHHPLSMTLNTAHQGGFHTEAR